VSVFNGWYDVHWQAMVGIALRSVIIYLVFLIGLRVFGKREVGQFTFFDLALILLVANALQPAMTGPDYSVVGGLVIVVVLLGLNWLISRLRLRSTLVRHMLEGTPTVIAQDGQWLARAMQHEGLDTDEAMMALREHGLADVSEVALAVLEVDGSISVVPREGGAVKKGSRRLRYRRRV
jgi:uncharacterized membrane protein YcaP (DUF421 family)